MYGCSLLRKFPDISTNITELNIAYTAVEELPESIRQWSRLHTLEIYKNRNLKTVTHVPRSVRSLDLIKTGIEMITNNIKGVHGLQDLFLDGCRKLASLPELPGSLLYLSANECASLESVSCPFNTPYAELNFTNCFKLNPQARRGIIQRSFLQGWACLPGRDLPTVLDHRSTGNSITIHLEGKSLFSASLGFKVFLVISPNQDAEKYIDPALFCRRIGIDETPIFICCLVHQMPCGTSDKCLEVGNEMQFEFSNISNAYKIIECGVRIYTDEADRGSDGRNEYELHQVSEPDNDWSYEFESSETSECLDCNGCTDRLTGNSEEDNIEGNKRTDCWSWLILCFDVSHM
ncbi:hypothetical protein EUTSA_v10028059mg, partial [Eutrema salsugineum]